ncbi:MAG: hypothetical protein JWR14_1488 [Caballeronia sp.]|nr:hypothetical protein [Caballeronia sp.]
MVPFEWSISGGAGRAGGTLSPGNAEEDVGGTAAPGGERAPVTAKAKRGARQKTARIATTTAKTATKRRATCRAVWRSGIDLPDFLGAMTGDVPTIDETQRRFFDAAFIDCIRAALMKCAT